MAEQVEVNLFGSKIK